MKTIKLDLFVPRDYQYPVIDALEKKGYRKILCIWPRRAGKDVVAWNLLIRQAIRHVGNYFYCLPTYRQAKLVIWDSITNTGQRFLDYIPRELIEVTNSQELKITLINGSIINLIGSDSYNNSLVGSNPRMIVFSEYALSNDQAYHFVRPILNANGGILLVLSTPRGKNHLYDLFKIAGDHPESWFVNRLSLTATKHIPLIEIERDRQEGVVSEEFIQQEYYTSFESMGVEGSIYRKALDRMILNEQFTEVPWRSDHQVNTAWDIGRDMTAIIFFQILSDNVHIIDYFEKSGEQLEFFAKYIQDKPYVYNKHFFPHDMRNIEWGGPKFTRVEKARQLGIRATIVDEVGLEDGIEYVRSTLSRIWIDQMRCKKLIQCLENYRREFDQEKRVYKEKPLHNYASHGADALRYLCISLTKAKTGMTAQDIKKLKEEALYEDHNTYAHPFNGPGIVFDTPGIIKR